MKAKRQTTPEDLRMSSKEFDRIMGRALQVKPKVAPKVKSKSKVRKRTTKGVPTK